MLGILTTSSTFEMILLSSLIPGIYKLVKNLHLARMGTHYFSMRTSTTNLYISTIALMSVLFYYKNLMLYDNLQTHNGIEYIKTNVPFL